MTIMHLIELIPDVWQTYRPLLPLNAVRDFLTAPSRPGEAWPGGGHSVTTASLAAAVLLGVAGAAAQRRVARHQLCQ